MKFTKLYNLICEDKIDDLIKKYPEWVTYTIQLKELYSKLSDDIKRHNKFGKFLEWLFINALDFLDIIDTTPANISADQIEEVFNGYLKYNIDLSDIISMSDLRDIIEQKKDAANRATIAFDDNVKKIYEDKDKYVIRVWNFEGAKKYGTSIWCISKDEFRWYDYILNPNICRNPYFVIYKTTEPKYFTAPESSEAVNLNKCCIQRDINDNLFITDVGNSVGDGLFQTDAEAALKFMKLDKIEDKFVSFKDDSEFETLVKKNDNWEKYLTTISPIYDDVVKNLEPTVRNMFELRKMWFDAINKQDEKEIQRLIDAGIDVNMKNGKDESALDIMAIKQFPIEFINLLFNHPKIDLNIKVGNTNRPLITNIYTNISNAEIVKQVILDPRIDINATDKYGISLLHEAATRISSQNLLETILTRKDLNVNIQTFRDKNTPLHSACAHGQYTNIMKLLTHPDINVNIQNKDGDTPLLWSIIFGNYECVRILLQDTRVDITIPNNKGTTAERITSNKRLLDLFRQYRGVT